MPSDQRPIRRGRWFVLAAAYNLPGVHRLLPSISSADRPADPSRRARREG